MDPDLHLGLELPSPSSPLRHGPAEDWPGAVRAAESAGFGTLWFGGDEPEGRRSPDPFVLAGAAAAWTRTISIGIVARLAPSGRHPSLVARALTSLDVVSGGRAALLLELDSELARTAGGWAHLSEAAAVCRSLLSQEVSTYPGRYYAVVEAANRPPPLRPGGPLLVAQLPPAALEGADVGRAVLDLWREGGIAALAYEGSPEDLVELRKALAEAGLPPPAEGGPGLLWRGSGPGAPVRAVHEHPQTEPRAEHPQAGPSADGLILRLAPGALASPETVEELADSCAGGVARPMLSVDPDAKE